MKKQIDKKPKINKLKEKAEKAEKAKCDMCYGYGLWATGDSSPIGPMDYSDGCPCRKCPKCGSGRNDGRDEEEKND